MTDLRSISIQYENKINGLYALFVSLERVNMRYIEKMKSRNNNPQTAKQQLKARLQICKNMKQVLKNTKKYEDVLTDEQKNLLPNSCNIDPLKPHSESLTELTNPYFKKPPTKQAKIPDLLTKEKSTLKFKKDKLSKMSPSLGSTASQEVLLSQIQDTDQGLNECSSTTISAKSETLHPWCKLTKTREEIKDKSSGTKHQTTIETLQESKKLQTSSNSAVKIQDSEDSEEDQFKTSQSKQQTTIETLEEWKEHPISSISAPKTEAAEDSEEGQFKTSFPIELQDYTRTGTKKKTEENVTSNKKEKTSIPQQKSNIKYTVRKIHQPSINSKRKVLSIIREEELYPWQQMAAKNREDESPLSDQIQKIDECANKILTPVMKSMLYQHINYPDSINKTITDKIGKQGKGYLCINCVCNPSFSTKRRDTIMKHVKSELGYYQYRCSFCDIKANDPRRLIHHYATTHGVPSEWLESNECSANN